MQACPVLVGAGNARIDCPLDMVGADQGTVVAGGEMVGLLQQLDQAAEVQRQLFTVAGAARRPVDDRRDAGALDRPQGFALLETGDQVGIGHLPSVAA